MLLSAVKRSHHFLVSIQPLNPAELTKTSCVFCSVWAFCGGDKRTESGAMVDAPRHCHQSWPFMKRVFQLLWLSYLRRVVSAASVYCDLTHTRLKIDSKCINVVEKVPQCSHPCLWNFVALLPLLSFIGHSFCGQKNLFVSVLGPLCH